MKESGWAEMLAPPPQHLAFQFLVSVNMFLYSTFCLYFGGGHRAELDTHTMSRSLQSGARATSEQINVP